MNYKNYELIKEEYLDEIKSNVKLLKHPHSGARIVLMENNDNNKTFTIGFRTPPIDDTGVPHIMEHSTLCGSKKFPAKDPFVELLKSSLNTFLNAMTFPDKTIYPVASCNDKDFANLMEVYLDAVFYPNVYIHEEIFKQEGWHYELTSLDDDITVNGVVYNEMKGAFSSVDEVVVREVLRGLYPDTTYGCESGGHPNSIPNLTYEQFKAFHKKLYSPANSYIILYGNMDFEERLKFLDEEYLSKFDVVDVDSHIDYQKALSAPVYRDIDYTVGQNGSIENKTQYLFSAVIGDYQDEELCEAFKALSYVLFDAPGAPVKEALLKKGLCKDVDSMYEDGILQPFFMIEAKDSKENAQEEFKETFMNALKEVVKNGVDKRALKAFINADVFRIKEADTGRTPKGLVYSIELLGSWLYDENKPFEKLSINKVIDKLYQDLETSYFEDLIEKYLINNTHVCYVTAHPSTTCDLVDAQKLKDKLKAYKDSLSKEELEKLIADTKALKEYQATPSTKEELAAMPTLERKDISKQGAKLYNTIEEASGVKIVKHDLETNGIGYLNLVFDAKNIGSDEVHSLSLLGELLGLVDTENYTYKDLDQEIDINSGGIFATSCSYKLEKGYMKALAVRAKYFYGKEDFVLKMIEEILIRSKFVDKTRIKELVQQTVQSLEGSMIYGGRIDSVAANRALSYIDEYAHFRDELNGIGSYNYFSDLEKNFDEKIDDEIDKMLVVLHKVVRKENLIISFTGKDEGFKKYLDNFTGALFNDKFEKGENIFTPNVLNEGFKIPSMVNYCARVGKINEEDYTGAFIVFEGSLRFDYLWIKVRVQGGAYGVSSSTSAIGNSIFTSYRDPHIKETYEAFEGTLGFIDEFNPTKEELDKFVISAIGILDFPNSPKGEGESSFSCYLRGTTEEKIQKTRDQVLNVTVQDIKNLRPIYENVLNQNVLCAIGNEQKIEENKDIFKEVKALKK